MNILLTCAGRRNYLVNYFKEALGGKGKVYTVNSTAEATSMLVADGAFVAPPLYEDGYINYLIKICRQYQVDLLVSLFDMELPILANNKRRFDNIGVVVAVSDPEVIDICNDKTQTSCFAKRLGLEAPFITTSIDKAIQKITEGSINFPLFIKPRWGMGSIAMQRAETLDELPVLFAKVQRDLKESYLVHYPQLDPNASVIIQSQANGQEYGLDIINDFEGNYVATFVKRKLAMRSGETDGAVTENVPALEDLGAKIGKELGHIGNLDADVFWDGNNRILLEMNARLGGGYPFSHMAGANLPKAYLDWTNGKVADNKDLSITIGAKGFKGLKIIKNNKMNRIF